MNFRCTLPPMQQAADAARSAVSESCDAVRSKQVNCHVAPDKLEKGDRGQSRLRKEARNTKELSANERETTSKTYKRQRAATTRGKNTDRLELVRVARRSFFVGRSAAACCCYCATISTSRKGTATYRNLTGYGACRIVEFKSRCTHYAGDQEQRETGNILMTKQKDNTLLRNVDGQCIFDCNLGNKVHARSYMFRSG